MEFPNPFILTLIMQKKFYSILQIEKPIKKLKTQDIIFPATIYKYSIIF